MMEEVGPDMYLLSGRKDAMWKTIRPYGNIPNAIDEIEEFAFVAIFCEGGGTEIGIFIPVKNSKLT